MSIIIIPDEVSRLLLLEKGKETRQSKDNNFCSTLEYSTQGKNNQENGCEK